MAGRTLDNLRSRYGGVGDRPAQGAAQPPRHGGPGAGWDAASPPASRRTPSA